MGDRPERPESRGRRWSARRFSRQVSRFSQQTTRRATRRDATRETRGEDPRARSGTPEPRIRAMRAAGHREARRRRRHRVRARPRNAPGRGGGIGKIFRAIFRESAPGFQHVNKMHFSNLTTVVVTLSLPSVRPSSLARLASMVANNGTRESLKTCARCKQTLDNTQGNFPHGSSWCIKCAPPDSDSD